MAKMEYEKLKLTLAILKAMRDRAITDEPLTIRRMSSVLGYSVEHLNKMKGWLIDMKLMSFAGKRRNSMGMKADSFVFNRMAPNKLLFIDWDETSALFDEAHDHDWLERNDLVEDLKRSKLY